MLNNKKGFPVKGTLYLIFLPSVVRLPFNSIFHPHKKYHLKNFKKILKSCAKGFQISAWAYYFNISRKQFSMDCLIVDDDVVFQNTLKHYVEETDFLKLSAVCNNAIEVSNLLRIGFYFLYKEV